MTGSVFARGQSKMVGLTLPGLIGRRSIMTSHEVSLRIITQGPAQ